MSDLQGLDELVAFLVRSTRLTAGEAARLVAEVLAYLDEAPEDYVRRRHRELQSQGLANTDIFERILTEMARRRFRAPAYSARQMRRIVYG